MAEKFDWEKIASKLLEAVGGKANVKTYFNCATRFRFEVFDDKKVNKELLKKVALVKGVNKEGDQWQVIFGAGTVNKVTDAFTKVMGNNGATSSGAKPPKKPLWNKNLSIKSNLFTNFRAGVRAFADIFVPLIPVFIAGGLSLALSSLIGQAPKSASATGAQEVFNLIGGGILGSLPAFVGYTAMKRFGGTPMLGLAIGIIMVAPSLLNGWVGSGNYVISGYDYSDDRITAQKIQYVIDNNSAITKAFQGEGAYKVGSTDLTGYSGWTITTLGTITKDAAGLNVITPMVLSHIVDGKDVTKSLDLLAFAGTQGLNINTARALFPEAPAFFSFSFVGYQAQVFPTLGIIALAFGIEKLTRRYSPEAVAILTVPLATVILSVFFGFLIIGPAGKYVGIGISIVFQNIYKYTNWPGFGLGGALLAAAYPWLVVTGLHQGFLPIEASLIADSAALFKHSFTWITPIASVANVAQGMVGFAIAVMLWKRVPTIRGKAVPSAISANLGITEPILFGVNLPTRFGLLAASAAAAVGGYWVGMTHTVATTNGSASWLGIVQFDFVKPVEYDKYLDYYGFNTTPNLRDLAPAVNIAIAMTLTSIAAFAFTFLFGKTFGKKSLREFIKNENNEDAVSGKKTMDLSSAIKVVAAASGKVTPSQMSKNEVIKKMGTGVIIHTTHGKIFSPIDGLVVLVSEDHSSFTIQAEDGTNVMVQIEVDTKKMPIKLLVSSGKEVKANQQIAEISHENMKNHAKKLEILVVASSETVNSRNIKLNKAEEVKEGQEVFEIHAKKEATKPNSWQQKFRNMIMR